MKHCSKCGEEYQDTAFRCAECGRDLVPGSLSEAAGASSGDHPASPEESGRPQDSEIVLTAPPEYAQPVAFALSKAGIPALVFDCAEPPEGLEGPLQDVLVPAQLYNSAVWFCRGFEAGAWPGEDEEGKILGTGRDPV